jgi:hypothetical protein
VQSAAYQLQAYKGAVIHLCVVHIECLLIHRVAAEAHEFLVFWIEGCGGEGDGDSDGGVVE